LFTHCVPKLRTILQNTSLMDDQYQIVFKIVWFAESLALPLFFLNFLTAYLLSEVSYLYPLSWFPLVCKQARNSPYPIPNYFFSKHSARKGQVIVEWKYLLNRLAEPHQFYAAPGRENDAAPTYFLCKNKNSFNYNHFLYVGINLNTIKLVMPTCFLW
jgi:hypothetical protein